jgi:hypothetical protein
VPSCRVHSDISRLELTTSIIWQGLILGLSFGGVIVFILPLLTVIYFGRKERLRRQAMRAQISIPLGVSTSGPVSEARRISQTQTQTSLAPFTVPLPSNILSAPLTTSSSTALPPPLPHTRDRPSASPRVDSEERDTMAEVLQRVRQLEELVQGHLSGERDRDRRIWRTSINLNDEDPFESRSDGTSDAPPTYVTNM